MYKVFLAEIKSRCNYYDDYDDLLNISEERYMEVDSTTYEKLKWYCTKDSQYVLLEWVEKDSDSYVSILEKVEKAWSKEQVRKEKEAKLAEERKAKSEEAARKRKLKQLEKLQKELGQQ